MVLYGSKTKEISSGIFGPYKDSCTGEYGAKDMHGEDRN